MPKGFLPRQDTGLLTAVLEAGPDVSFDAMKTLQAGWNRILRQGRHRRGLGSRRRPAQPDDQCRPSLDHAARRATTAAHVSPTLNARLRNAVAGIPGMTLYFEPVQDIQITTRISRSQYQYT